MAPKPKGCNNNKLPLYIKCSSWRGPLIASIVLIFQHPGKPSNFLLETSKKQCIQQDRTNSTISKWDETLQHLFHRTELGEVASDRTDKADNWRNSLIWSLIQLALGRSIFFENSKCMYRCLGTERSVHFIRPPSFDDGSIARGLRTRQSRRQGIT